MNRRQVLKNARAAELIHSGQSEKEFRRSGEWARVKSMILRRRNRCGGELPQ